MTEELKKYENSINKKHSFGWTPEYEEEFRTDLNKTVFFKGEQQKNHNGIFWAWVIHFLQDVIIIGSLYLMKSS